MMLSGKLREGAKTMTSNFIQAALAIAGLAIFSGLYFGGPGKGLRGGLITIGIVIAVAFIISLLR